MAETSTQIQSFLQCWLFCLLLQFKLIFIFQLAYVVAFMNLGNGLSDLS